ncbi:MAG: hypothetical protein R3F11_21820 [Verrucomicrobiales bacterium]
MYGDMPLDEVMGEVKKAGAESLDIWESPRDPPRGDRRDRWDAFGALLEKHGVAWGVNTRYPLGSVRLGKEMPMMKRFGCQVAVCGTAGGPKEPNGRRSEEGHRRVSEKMKLHAEKAEAHGITIAGEPRPAVALHARFAALLRRAKQIEGAGRRLGTAPPARVGR